MRIRLSSLLKKTVSFCVAGGSMLLCLSITNCSSDDDEPTGSAGKGGSSVAGAGAGKGGMSGAGGTAAGGTAGRTNAGGTSGAGGNNGSEACTKFCDCYQKKCAGFVAIPGGMACLDFCATFVNQKTFFDCRQSMCDMSGGPEVNNNDHCQHALGLGQCN